MILEYGKCAQGKEITLHFISTVLLMENFVVQSFSCVQLFVTPWTAACQASLAFTVSQSLLKLMSIELVMPFNHLFVPFSCPQSFQHQSLFPVSQLFTSGGQSTGASVSASVLLMSIEG